MKTLIKNVIILTMDEQLTVYPDGYLIFENKDIIAVGNMSELSIHDCQEVIDGNRAIVLPGLINTHTHVGMIPFRSLGDDVPDRLRRFLFPLEEYMTPELAYYSAKYAIAEMQLAGVTSFVDMYYFEDDIARATDEMLARAILGETVIDFPTCDAKEAHGGLTYSRHFIPKWLGHELITPAIAPHAPNTNSKQALMEAAKMAEQFNVPLTLHVAEMDYEMAHFAKEYNQTPVEYLADINFLSERVIAAHCIHLTENDIAILKQHKTKVAHCIGANTKSAKGVSPVKAMLENSIDVGLGTDGPSSGNTLDLFCQMKLFANFHKTTLHDRSAFPASEIVKLATIGGARVMGMADKIGSLQPGKKADFIMVETQSANMFPVFDPYAVLVYSANASNVENVFINGVAVVRNKQLCHHSLKDIRQDLDENMSEFRQQAARLAAR